MGHVFPMIPLAWALRAAGHEVLVATAGDALAAKDAGLPVVDLVPGFDIKVLYGQVLRDNPELAKEMEAGMKVTDLRDPVVLSRLALVSMMLTDGAVALAEQWKPDVVVESMILGAGHVVAGKLGIPLFAHGFGFARGGGLAPRWREYLAAQFQQHGAELPERTGYIDIAPPSMLHEQPTGWSMRFVPYNAGGVLPDWARRTPERRQIIVTLGTIAPIMSGLGPVERLLAAAPDIDADFILALGSADTSGLGAMPSNVRVVDWIPLDALLQHSPLLIHHGGAGTTLTALAMGVPQIALPSGADRYINAIAMHDSGAGVSVEEDELDAALIDRVLTDDKIRHEAGRIRDEIAGLPTPGTVAARLHEFVVQR
ncbi:nucleotide disphospho-sugar-binding domain-containing protein [Nocardia tengchongensis]|uniref:nucleotide disphospho-sugar-binding domain-containing protein n=1 Tax=Nocardia tengchongensis TaxID=2055889 RepID=UPI0033EE4136